ncbi:MAG: tautomerase family protein [Planctomycetota bacterium]|jgi:phenylpyruvate tautomerase PptA (4-oxalocrotonate tautomerase family)
MPILEVEMVGAPAGRDPLAQRVADAAGEVLGTPPAETWVRLRVLDPQDYAENGGRTPDDLRPVFVSVLQARPPDGEARAREARALTEAVAKACGRPPARVHVLYQPPAAGRIAFGGRLVT